MRSRIASLARLALGVACAGLFVCHTAGAQPLVPNVTVDENGHIIINGTPGTGFLAPDPGPGGLASALTYDLPFFVVPGDVFLFDTNEPGSPVLDVIRFNNSFFDGGVDIAALDGSPFTLVFYSDNSDGFDALADTVSPPGLLYPNIFSIAEIGPEGNNGAFYTPLPGQPGYVEEDGVVGVAGVTYHFVSDGTIPEPSSTALLALGLAVLVLGVGQRRRTRRA